MSKYKYLEEPMVIRGKKYKNRLIAAPTLFAHSVFFFPEIAENVYRMVENRAKGGFAAVSTGEFPLNNEEGTALFMERTIDTNHYEGEDFLKMKEYADRIRKYGALSYFEVTHEGAMAETKGLNVPWGPDQYIRDDGVKVHALNKSMMNKICRDYTKIGKFARACGFDGVLLHGGHGFNQIK